MHNSLKDQILEAVDIVAVIGERVALTRKGKEWVGLCPFHNDHKPSFNVSPSKRIFKCWSCGVAGDVFKFVMLRDRVEFSEAVRILAERAGIDARQSGHAGANARRRDQLLSVTAWAAGHFQRNLQGTAAGRTAHAYVARRGISPETLEQHLVGVAPDSWDDLVSAARRAGLSTDLLIDAGLVAKGESGKIYDRFRNRLIFPIRDPSGRPIAFGGRTLGDDPAKYLNSPETPLFSKSRILYELHLARAAMEQSGSGIVVEGYMDAVLLHQHGISNCVATLGTSLTDAHVKVLKRFTTTLVLCFDGDAAGLKAADRAVETALRTAMDVRVVILPDGQDPADCVVASGGAGFQQALIGQVDALQFKWGRIVKDFEGRGPVARRLAMEAFLQFVGSVVDSGGIDPLEQGLLAGRLSDCLAVPPTDVYEMLAKTRRARNSTPVSAPASAGAGSAYSEAIRGLPAGIVATVEELLGQLVSDCETYRLVDDSLARGVRLCPVWKRLYDICLGDIELRGGYQAEEILSACDDSELCELFERCRRRAADAAVPQNLFSAGLARLAAELDVLRIADLRVDCRTASEDENAFRAMLEVSRRTDWGILSIESRLNAPSAS